VGDNACHCVSLLNKLECGCTGSPFFGSRKVGNGVDTVLTKGFSPQAIETKAGMRVSGLGTENISPLNSGLVQRLFLRKPRAKCCDYFSANVGLRSEDDSLRLAGLVGRLFHRELRA